MAEQLKSQPVLLSYLTTLWPILHLLFLTFQFVVLWSCQFVVFVLLRYFESEIPGHFWIAMCQRLCFDSILSLWHLGMKTNQLVEEEGNDREVIDNPVIPKCPVELVSPPSVPAVHRNSVSGCLWCRCCTSMACRLRLAQKWWPICVLNGHDKKSWRSILYGLGPYCEIETLCGLGPMGHMLISEYE